MTANRRFRELDSLRGLASLAVVLSHFAAGLGDTDHPIFRWMTRLPGSGHAAVVLFFLLSGFVLTTSYLGDKQPTYAAFMVKRGCRIYLPYVAAILIAAGFASQLYSESKTGDAWIDQTWSRPFSASLLLQHLIMVGHFDCDQWNTAIWSLIIEMRISLVFPMIAWITARTKTIPTAVACIPITIAIAMVCNSYGHEFFCDTVFYVMVFILGSMMRRRYDQLETFFGQFTGWQSETILLAGYGLYRAGDVIPFARTGASPALAHYLSEWTLALAASVILLSSTTFASFRHLLDSRAITWAGSRSYSIYLIHGTVLFALLRTHHGLNLSWVTFSTYLALTGIGAEAFYRLIETPSMRLGRRLGRRLGSSMSFNSPSYLISPPQEMRDCRSSLASSDKLSVP